MPWHSLSILAIVLRSRTGSEVGSLPLFTHSCWEILGHRRLPVPCAACPMIGSACGQPAVMRYLSYFLPRPPYPLGTWSVCALLVAVYFAASAHLGPFYSLGLSSRPEHILAFYERYGLVPSAVPYAGLTGLLSFATGLFVHAGPFHLFPNLVFCRLFGAPVEDRAGAPLLLSLLLTGGLFAAFSHCWLYPQSTLALVGSSGGVAALAGAFVFLPGRLPAVSLGAGSGPFRIECSGVAMVALWVCLQLLGVVVHLVQRGDGALVVAPHVAGFLFGAICCSAWRRLSLVMAVPSDDD